MKKILIIVSHPDDEILGCGGTIYKHVSKKDKVYVYFTHEGSSGRFTDLNNPKILIEIKKRKDIAKNLAKKFKYKIIGFADNQNLYPNQVDVLKNVKKIIEIINLIKPDIVYTHFNNDMHADHNLTHDMVITACRPANFFIKEIYLMEIPSSTNWKHDNIFSPNLFINININQKLKQMKYYKSEFRKDPHPTSINNIKALAMYRGSQVGFNFAESFMVYKKIIS